MIEKRFTLGKDYDCDGNWEYCYIDNKTGRIFNFADDFCETDFLELINAVINKYEGTIKKLEKDNKELITKNNNFESILKSLKNKNDEICLKDGRIIRLRNCY